MAVASRQRDDDLNGDQPRPKMGHGVLYIAENVKIPLPKEGRVKMAYNADLVRASKQIDGVEYNYFWQGTNPWCQTLAARWLRKHAKGQDPVPNDVPPANGDTMNRDLWMNQGRDWKDVDLLPETAYTRNLPGQILVPRPEMTNLKDKVTRIKEKICRAAQKVNPDQMKLYVEYGCGPLLNYQIPDDSKRCLILNEEDFPPTIGPKQWDQVPELFRKVDSYWLISRGHLHMMAAYNTGALFTFFDPDAGEFKMNNNVLEDWLKLEAVKNTVVRDKDFTTFSEYRKSPNYQRKLVGREEKIVDAQLENI